MSHLHGFGPLRFEAGRRLRSSLVGELAAIAVDLRRPYARHVPSVKTVPGRSSACSNW